MSLQRREVWYSLPAKTDLKAIYRYIAVDLQSRFTAKIQTNHIREVVKRLAVSAEDFPFVDLEPWASLDVRKTSVDNFIVFYRANYVKRRIEVIRIFYGGRYIESIIKAEQK